MEQKEPEKEDNTFKEDKLNNNKEIPKEIKKEEKVEKEEKEIKEEQPKGYSGYKKKYFHASIKEFENKPEIKEEKIKENENPLENNEKPITTNTNTGFKRRFFTHQKKEEKPEVIEIKEKQIEIKTEPITSPTKSYGFGGRRRFMKQEPEKGKNL